MEQAVRYARMLVAVLVGYFAFERVAAAGVATALAVLLGIAAGCAIGALDGIFERWLLRRTGRSPQR